MGRSDTHDATRARDERTDALVETWALCERCLAYLKDCGVARLKADGRAIRWMETDYGHPVTGRPRCDACHVRRAAKYAVLRVARPAR